MPCTSEIYLKRGQSANVADAVIKAGEPAFALDTEKLYIGLTEAGGTEKVLINPLSEEQASDILTAVGDLGTAADVDTGTAPGQIPVLDGDGKFPSSAMPAIAITNTYVVDSEEAMLALTVEVGDVAIRTDESKSYIVKSNDGKVIGDWEWLIAPTDEAIVSVNGLTGPTVVITAGNSQLTLDGYDPQPCTEVTSPVATDTVLEAIEKLDVSIDFVFEKFTEDGYIKDVNGKTGAEVTLYSSDITMGDEYVLPSACSPVESTDTIAQAVAKLEKHLQVIDGGTF